MREFFEKVATVYILLLLLATTLGAIIRVGSPDNCKVVWADYVFAGLPRLTCEVGK